MGFFGIIDRADGFSPAEKDFPNDVDRRRRLLTYRFAVLSSALVLVYNIIYLSFGYFELWLANSAILSGCLIAALLQRKGRTTTAKVTLITTCSAGLLGLGTLFGSDSTLPILCNLAALLCPLLFSRHERVAMVLSFVFALACFVGFSVASSVWTWPSTTSLAFRKAVETSCLIGISLVTFLTLAQLTLVYESLNHQITRKSQRLSLQQQEIKDSQERKAALLAALPDACFLVEFDPENNQLQLKEVQGRVHPIWTRACKKLQLSALLSEKSRNAFMDALEMARTQNVAHSFSFQWQRWNHTFHAEARMARLYENEFILIIRDVTKEHHDRMALRSQELKLIHASKMAVLGEMAGNIAHEINNPLAVVVGLTDMAGSQLKDIPHDTAGVQDLLTRISNTAKRIARITVGLRQMSRDGRSDPLEPVRLACVIDDALALCENSLKTKGVTVKIEPQLASHIVMSRSVQLGQVLLNLIGNASDALEGQPTREITLSAERTNGRVLLRVADTGPRLAKSVADSLFVPFFTTKGAGKGTGLGLSISRGIVESQGGRLFLDTQRRDTCFCIELHEADEGALNAELDAQSTLDHLRPQAS